MPKLSKHFQSAMPRDAVIKLLHLHNVPTNDIAMICGLTNTQIRKITESQSSKPIFDYMHENEKNAVKNFSVFLYSWRIAECITQPDAAKILNIDLTTYFRWENNLRHCSTALILIRYIRSICTIPINENKPIAKIRYKRVSTPIKMNITPEIGREFLRIRKPLTPEAAREFLRHHKP